MPMQSLPTPPSREDPANFRTRADQFLAALATFATEANALETNVNAKEVSATTAASTATTQAGISLTKADEAAASAAAAAEAALGLPNGLNISGTARRITGDFSNATQSDRLLFQSSTTDGYTNFGAIPNGTSQSVQFTGFASSDPTNASAVQMGVDVPAGRVWVSSFKTGTGTYLPLEIDVGGNTGAARFETDGRFSYKNLSAFGVRKSADQVLPGISQYLVSFDTYDYGAGALSSSIYTAPRDGVYAFAATIRLDNTSGAPVVATVGLEATINSGGTVATIDVDTTNNINAGGNWYGKLYREYRLLAGESVRVWANASVTGVTVNDSYTLFTGRYVGD